MNIELKPGMKFRNQYMPGVTEVVHVDTEKNSLAVLLPDGHFDDTWNLQHAVWGFERGEYRLIRDYISEGFVWAKESHRRVNQHYGKYPYELHLEFAFWVAERFIGFIPERDREIVLVAVAGHDTIEDTRQTFNDVRLAVGPRAAELILACSSPCDLRSRKERNFAVYPKVEKLQYAAFVKLCDRIANVAFGRFSETLMFKKYTEEMPEFISGISGLDKNQTWFKEMVKMLKLVSTIHTGSYTITSTELSALEAVESYYRYLITCYPKCNPGGELVYLARPIGGMPEYNKPAFDQYEVFLQKQGYRVLNPHRICKHLPQEITTWEEYMKTNMPELLQAKRVFFIPNWMNSDGSILEFFIAWRFKIPVFELFETNGNIGFKPLQVNTKKQWYKLIHKITAVPLERTGFLIDLSIEKKSSRSRSIKS